MLAFGATKLAADVTVAVLPARVFIKIQLFDENDGDDDVMEEDAFSFFSLLFCSCPRETLLDVFTRPKGRVDAAAVDVVNAIISKITAQHTITLGE